ncbi:MAG: DUF1428 domain-containing protein [Alphaproteobacteria bacterium]|nr:DUF1428 domain-containing protein [Alphaproteobacteria bacterium]
MAYIDGFLIAVPKAKLDDYRKMAELGEKVWREHGAIAYVESVGDDLRDGELTSFPRAVMAKDDEVVIFSWIVYPSREARDATNAKVMSDPRLVGQMEMPFDAKRLIFGGFRPLLGL